jgi:hypothetical protein
MQPLDIAFVEPFETYYAQEVEQWIRSNPGHVVNIY